MGAIYLRCGGPVITSGVSGVQYELGWLPLVSCDMSTIVWYYDDNDPISHTGSQTHNCYKVTDMSSPSFSSTISVIHRWIFSVLRILLGVHSSRISTCAVITIFNLHWLNIQCPQPGHWPVSPGYPKYVVLRLKYLRPPHVTSDTLHFTIQITICIFACQQATQFYFNIQTSFNNMSCNIN